MLRLKMSLAQIQRLINGYGIHSSVFLVIVVLISTIIYLVVDRSKIKPSPPPLECPKCPIQYSCFNYELMSQAKGNREIVSPGVMYQLSVGNNSVTLKGYDDIWKVEAPGAVIMALNEKGQLQAKNAEGRVVYETPAVNAHGPYVAYVSNEGKLKIIDWYDRKVVFSK